MTQINTDFCFVLNLSWRHVQVSSIVRKLRHSAWVLSGPQWTSLASLVFKLFLCFCLECTLVFFCADTVSLTVQTEDELLFLSFKNVKLCQIWASKSSTNLEETLIIIINQCNLFLSILFISASEKKFVSKVTQHPLQQLQVKNFSKEQLFCERTMKLHLPWKVNQHS